MIFWSKNGYFSSKCSECINMHQNASKCMQNELCKCFVHEIIKEVVFITFKQAKIDELLVALCDGRPCRLTIVFYVVYQVENYVGSGTANTLQKNTIWCGTYHVLFRFGHPPHILTLEICGASKFAMCL